MTLVKDICDVIKIIGPGNVSEELKAFKPSYNASPGQMLPLLFEENAQKVMGLSTWGMANPHTGYRLSVNARIETLLGKQYLNKPAAFTRAVLITDGYFEWKDEGGDGKIPYYIRKADRGLIFMAALSSETNHRKEFTVITRPPIESIDFIHGRMPAILDIGSVEEWISDRNTSGNAMRILSAFSGPLDFYTVSRAVNSTANNSPVCLEKTCYHVTENLF